MKQVLFEEDGAFRVGTILAEAGASFQVEAAHGKRSKVKATSILLRFDGQPLTQFMPEAQKLSEPLDPQFLWEVCGPEEFGFEELAREYHGRAPTPQEAAAVALTLHAHPIYFYKRGKGRYQAAPAENLKAALVSELKSEDGNSMAYVFHDAGDAAGTVESRFFFPNGAAILEDPATGSACANLGGWFTVVRPQTDVKRVVSQGEAVARPSTLYLDVSHGAIHVGGDVVELGRGSVHL